MFKGIVRSKINIRLGKDNSFVLPLKASKFFNTQKKTT